MRDDDGKGRPATRAYAVGYAKPPAEHRFKKGTSGNPRGRPKAQARAATSTLAEAVSEMLSTKIHISRDGKIASVTRLDALVESIFKNAFLGKPAALRLINSLIETGHDRNVKRSVRYDTMIPLDMDANQAAEIYQKIMRGLD